MSQHDYVIDNAAGATVRADINSAIQAGASRNSGTSAPSTTYANMVWVDTTDHLVKERNEANSAWVIRGRTDAEGVKAITGATSVAVRDYGKLFDATSGTFSLSLLAAATATDGFWFAVRNSGSGTVTIDPNGAETINGASTLALAPNESAIVSCNGTLWRTVGYTSTTAGLPKGYISGLVPTNAADTDHDITFSAGEARDAADSADMELASAITKQIDAAWAVGTNQGGIDTGAVANSTWYALWLIKRSDTGVVDALFSASFSAPTMPTNYDKKRLIGAVLTNGFANIINFIAFEGPGGALFVDWLAPPEDVSAAVSASRTSYTLSVPPANVLAHVIWSTSSTGAEIFGMPPGITDPTVALSSSMANFGFASGSIYGVTSDWVRTNSSGQIALKGSSASGNWHVRTLGWLDMRRP